MSNETDFDPVIGYVGETPPTDLPGIAEMMLAKPLDQFVKTVRFLGLAVTDALYHHEMTANARLLYLNVLRARREQLMRPLPSASSYSTERKHKAIHRRIQHALGLAICHLQTGQTGAMTRQQVLAELRAVKDELDTPAPLPPAA